MAVWPVTLPEYWQVSGFKETGADNTIRTRMDVGPAKVRRRTATNIRTVSGRMWLTNAQYTIMRTFYETDTLYGSDTFTMDDVHGTNRTWRFTKPPEYTTVGPNNWQVTLNLEEMP